MTDTATIISIGAVSISALGMIWTYFGGILSIRKELYESIEKVKTEYGNTNKSLTDVLMQQSSKITRLETKMDLFWNAIGGSVLSLIKQPIHFKKDQLMDKLIPENLPRLPETTVEELYELKAILNDELITLREIKDPKSLAYGLAIAYIDQILYDKGLLKGECQ
jgi:hypothetical protein